MAMNKLKTESIKVMTKNRIYLILCTLFVAFSAMAQETDTVYYAALQDFFTASPVCNSLRGKVAVARLVAQKEVEKAEKEGGIATKHTAETFMEDVFGYQLLAKELQPMLEKTVTEAELRQLTDSLTSPRGKAFTEHIEQVFPDKYVEHYSKALLKAILAYKVKDEMAELPISGLLPSVSPAQGIKKSYRKQFIQFYETADLAYAFQGELLERTMADLRSKLMREHGIYLTTSLMKRVQAYMDKNYRAMAMNACHGTLTEDDMAFAQSLASLPAYGKVVEVMAGFDPSSETVVLNVRLRYTEWLQEKGLIEK